MRGWITSRRRTSPEVPRLWQWPVRLTGITPTGVNLVLRPLCLRDGPEFTGLRQKEREWLSPWDPTPPDGEAPVRSFADVVRRLDADGAAARALPLVIEVNGAIVGQLNINSIVHGSFRSGYAGYWVSRAMAGRLVAPTALATVGDHLFEVGLHRIEVNIRPENAASLAVVQKLGFREEGLRRRYLHIDGDWRDHRSFALTREDLGGDTLRGRLARRART